jgi:hypothetical protein
MEQRSSWEADSRSSSQEILTVFDDEYKVQSVSLYGLQLPPVTSSLLSANIFLSTLFSNTLSINSYRNVRDESSRLYKTT